MRSLSTLAESGEALCTFTFLLNRELKEGIRLLDAGCGTGRLFRFGFRDSVQSFQGIGVDIDHVSVRKAKELSKDLRFDTEFVVADVRKLPFRRFSFDVVASRNVIEHLKQPYEAIKETAFVLNSGGHFLITTPNILGLRTIVNKLFPRAAQILHKSLAERSPEYIAHYNLNSLKKLLKSVNKNAFRIKKIFMVSPRYPFNLNAIMFRLWKIYNKLTSIGVLKYTRGQIILVMELKD